MKKIFFYIAALAVITAACTNEDSLVTVPTNNGTSEGKMITETITATNGDAPTRAAIADADGAFTWSEGDQVAVHASDGKYYTTEALTANSSDETATFTVTYSGSRDAFAVFPASIVATDAENYGQSGSPLDVTLPSSYTLAEVSGTKTPCPMIATNDPGSTEWEFKQLCGLLRLTLESIPATATSIQITFDQNVAGSFSIPSSVAPETSEIAAANHSGVDSKVITITGLTGAATTYDINLPLPTGEYEKVYITYLDNTSQELYKAIKYLSSTVPTTSVPAPTYTAQRAHGKKVTVDPSKLAFRGYWVAPGTLKREVDGSNVTYSITDGNPTEFIDYYGKSTSLNKYYFQKATLSAEQSKFPEGWKLPSQSEWKTFIWSNPQTAIYFNGTSITGDPTNAQKGCFILIHLVDTDVDVYGMLLLRDGAHIVCSDIETSNVGKKSSSNISTVNLTVLNRLISDYGCVFLPGTGNYMKNRGGGEWLYLQSESYLPNEELTNYFWIYISSAVSITNNLSTGPEIHTSIYYPVRLIKAAN